MRPKPPPFDFFSPIPHRPLHMGINPQNPRSNFGVLAEEQVLVTDFHHQKDIWVPLLEVHHSNGVNLAGYKALFS
ncbi:Hypothetical predicted protein [Prunus dulcis]|uniref:Uncharacterized protein n=2 Tax=Prunus dulcis TaxID=3755 RepID=A0A5E4GMA3_PRUDU|nr:Hypothetical predicted protein [Prunus dulcis]